MKKQITVNMTWEEDDKNIMEDYDYNKAICQDIHAELSCCWNYFENVDISIKDVEPSKEG